MTFEEYPGICEFKVMTHLHKISRNSPLSLRRSHIYKLKNKIYLSDCFSY